MVLGADHIIELINKGVNVVDKEGKINHLPLIENMSEEQIKGIEGTTVDLRLKSLHKHVGRAKLMVNSRVTPETKIVADINNGDKTYIIKPGEYLLAQTIEKINMPDYLVADLHPRSTMFRSGLALYTTYISPNFQGYLTVGLKHIGEHPVEIELGFRILACAFFQIDGKAVPYQGVWQGNRVSTQGKHERPY